MKSEEQKISVEGAAVDGNRREFLRACVRYPVLGGLAFLGAWLADRAGHSTGVEPCVKSRVCRSCQLFVNCDKPQAVQTKKMTND